MNKTIYEQNYKIFLVLLKEKREQKNITQAQLAVLLETQQTSVSKMERGERRIDFLEFWNICKVIGISPVEFINEFEKKIIT